MLRSGSIGPLAEGAGILCTEADAARGDGRGLEVGLVTNMDLVPSTNRPPRGGTSGACPGVGLCGVVVGYDGDDDDDRGGGREGCR